MNFKTRGLRKEDIPRALEIIRETTKESYIFEKRNMNEYRAILEEEVLDQRDRLEKSIISDIPYCIVLEDENDSIVGTIGYNYPGKSARDALMKLNKDPENTIEIISLYIDPPMQKNGLGGLLFNKIKHELLKTDFQFYCLTTAFDKGKSFWTKNLGEATLIMKDYYEDSVDCYFWINKI